jgi:hypothetical protein
LNFPINITDAQTVKKKGTKRQKKTRNRKNRTWIGDLYIHRSAEEEEEEGNIVFVTNVKKERRGQRGKKEK